MLAAEFAMIAYTCYCICRGAVEVGNNKKITSQNVNTDAADEIVSIGYVRRDVRIYYLFF